MLKPLFCSILNPFSKTQKQPAVSIGNVGQLAADLLIATLGLEPCGTMLSPTALPAAGLGATGGSGSGGSDGGDDEEGRERLSTELELFCPPASSSSSSSSSSGWVLLQQRAPDAPGASRAAARALGAWAQKSGISKILVLASVDAADRRDAALSSSPSSSGPKKLAFVWSGGAAEFKEWAARAESCGASSLPSEEEEQQRASSHETGLPPRSERRLPPWPLLAVANDSAVAPPPLALLSYATEGDNAADAVALAAAAAKVLGVEVPASASSNASASTSAAFSKKGTIPVSGPWRAPAAWAAAYGGREVPVEM